MSLKLGLLRSGQVVAGVLCFVVAGTSSSAFAARETYHPITSKQEYLVEKGDMKDTIKPYYNIYKRNEGYSDESKAHRDRLDERRAAYAAPLVSARMQALGPSEADSGVVAGGSALSGNTETGDEAEGNAFTEAPVSDDEK